MFHTKFINKKKVIYSDLIPEVEHFFTTRETVIRSEKKSLKPLIDENMLDILNYLQLDSSNFISPLQTHLTNIKIANYNQNKYQNTDGLILDSNDLGIYLNFADCTPVILYDKEHNIGAIVHAGWRGTVGKIVPKAINIMKDKYFSNPKNIYAIIGPTISICCYGIGDDVFDQLKASVSKIDKYTTNIYDRKYVDLKGINKQQLRDIGVPRKNIDICRYCTCCNNDLFFSYRKESGTSSRHSAVLKLIKK